MADRTATTTTSDGSTTAKEQSSTTTSKTAQTSTDTKTADTSTSKEASTDTGTTEPTMSKASTTETTDTPTTKEAPAESTGGVKSMQTSPATSKTSAETKPEAGTEGTTTDCFTANGVFSTPDGPKRADQLTVGDKILTLNNGFRPVRYIFSRTVHAWGEKAPVTFAPGILNNPDVFECSQKHRLYSGSIPIYKGRNKDHLLCAFELSDGKTVQIKQDGREVTYYHVLLDSHDLVLCSGVVSESWVPSKQYLTDSPETDAIFAAFETPAAATMALEGKWAKETITFSRHVAAAVLKGRQKAYVY